MNLFRLSKLLCIVLLFVLAACQVPATPAPPTSVPPTAIAPASPTSPPPSTAIPPTQVSPTATPLPTATATPTVTPARAPLVPVNVTESCGRCAGPQLVMDAQETLHLFWRAGGDSDVGYAQMKAGGKWLRQALQMSYANEFWYIFATNYKLMRNPVGQACVIAPATNYQTNESATLVRCHDGTSWRDTQKVSIGGCAYAFAPDGQLRALNAKQLSENPKAVLGCIFTIDRNGGYHALWWTEEPTKSVLYRFSTDDGKTWSAAAKLADEYSLPDLQTDAQGDLYYWASSGYRRWVPTKGWEAPVDVRRYGIERIIRLAPAADGRLRVIGQTMGRDGLYYFVQLADGKWSEPILVSQNGINADLVIDAKGVAHLAFDESREIYYVAVR